MVHAMGSPFWFAHGERTIPGRAVLAAATARRLRYRANHPSSGSLTFA